MCIRDSPWATFSDFQTATLSLFKDEEVILPVGLGEIIAGDLAEAGPFNLGADDRLVEAVVRAIAILVDDAEASSGLKRHSKIGKDKLGMRDLVVDLQHQGSVERIRRELWIIGSPQERLDITEMLALGSLLDIGDAFGVDVLSDDPAVRSDPAGGANAEPCLLYTSRCV